MPTQLKSDTARVNGAKSQGPKTAEGRAKSSRNAVKHGLSSRNPLVLECENDDDFQALHLSQMEIHQPATPAEKDLVDQMVAARWRMLRLQAIESDLLDTRLRRNRNLDRRFPTGSTSRLSGAYAMEANDSRAMALASRCESRFSRMYQSSYRILRELQATRAKQSTEPATPEPTQPEPPPPPNQPANGQPAEKNLTMNPNPASLPPVGQAIRLPFRSALAPFRARQPEIRNPTSEIPSCYRRPNPIDFKCKILKERSVYVSIGCRQTR